MKKHTFTTLSETDYQIILASKSPRRQELLAQLDVPFEVVIKEDVEEVFSPQMAIKDVPTYLAKLKAKPYLRDIQPNELVITADTIVVVDNQILGKPEDRADAVRMLELLSGKMHEVITGVALTAADHQKVFDVSTKVFFKALSSDEINYYVDQYKPFDKAGAYGIQEWIGMTGIEHIEGSYFNVVGLPVQRLYKELTQF